MKLVLVLALFATSHVFATGKVTKIQKRNVANVMEWDNAANGWSSVNTNERSAIHTQINSTVRDAEFAHENEHNQSRYLKCNKTVRDEAVGSADLDTDQLHLTREELRSSVAQMNLKINRNLKEARHTYNNGNTIDIYVFDSEMKAVKKAIHVICEVGYSLGQDRNMSGCERYECPL